MEDIISDIINSLVSDNSKLENALLKTKILAYKIKNDVLINWVNNELNGYPKESELPDYRKFTCRVMGTMSNGFQRVSNTAIPIFHLDSKMLKSLTEFNFNDGIGSLEFMIGEAKTNRLMINIPPEMCAFINYKIPTSGGLVVEFAHKEISIQAIKDISSAVKSKLLEFLLELESNFNLKLSNSDMEDKKDKINDLINTTIYGNNNVIITGDNNKQKVSYKIKQNDLNELLEFLSKEGVEKNDLVELETIVLSEKPDYETKTFGPKVKGWIKKMTSKALDGIWQVSLSSAGQILGEALNQYYGI